MVLKKDQQLWLEWLRQHGSPHGMTLGRGRPHDRRTIQTLINAYLIVPIFLRDPLVNEYAVRGQEDGHGLALLTTPDGQVCGATHYGQRVRRFSPADYASDIAGEALQNGIDTSLELYPEDDVRREWIQWAIARSTLASYD